MTFKLDYAIITETCQTGRQGVPTQRPQDHLRRKEERVIVVFDERFDSISAALVDEMGTITNSLDVLPTPDFNAPNRRISIRGNVAVLSAPDSVRGFGNTEDHINRNCNYGGVQFKSGKASFFIIAETGAYAREGLEHILDIVKAYNAEVEATRDTRNEAVAMLTAAVEQRVQRALSEQKLTLAKEAQSAAEELREIIDIRCQTAPWFTRNSSTLTYIQEDVGDHLKAMKQVCHDASLRDQMASMGKLISLEEVVADIVKALKAVDTSEPTSIEETAPIAHLGEIGDIIKSLRNLVQSRDIANTPGWNAQIRHEIERLYRLVQAPAEPTSIEDAVEPLSAKVVLGDTPPGGPLPGVGG